MTLGWSFLLLGLLLRNSEVGLCDPQCSCDMDGTWREQRLWRLGWFL